MSDKYVFERSTMEDLADSVRSVVGTTEEMTASEMSYELSNFSTGVGEAITNQDTLIAQINAAIEGKSAGGVVLPELNNPASAENIDSGYEVVDGEGNLLTGTSTKVQLPTLSNPASADKILSGYEAIDSIGSKVTGSIGSKAAQTITPSTTDQTIAAGQYLSGTQTIKGDANLIAANILKGISIFGVAGSLDAPKVVYGTTANAGSFTCSFNPKTLIIIATSSSNIYNGDMIAYAYINGVSYRLEYDNYNGIRSDQYRGAGFNYSNNTVTVANSMPRYCAYIAIG